MRCAVLMGCALLVGTAAPQKKTPAPSRANVLLITVDTLRADHVGAYGDAKIATPAMDSLARDGVLFERAISQVPLTFPSHASILTGMYPFSNGVQDFTSPPLSPKFGTLAEAFQHSGYATGAVVSSFVLDRSWGLARGFDSYDDAFAPEAYEHTQLALVERRANDSVEHALAWLKKPRTKPFFFWLHLYDPHSPYNPPEPFHTQYKDDLYSGEIAYADAQLARVLAYLRQSGVYTKTVVALMSDHGESLGEHGEREHGFFIYDSTTRVPLIIKPAGAPKMTRVSESVELAAVAATLLDLAGVKDKFADQAQSPSLVPLMKGESPAERPAYSETFYPFSSFGWSPLRGVQTRAYQYIDAPKQELYNLRGDPAETKNAANDSPAVTSAFKATLDERASKFAARAETGGSQLSADAAEKLRALGYVASKAPISEEALKRGLADPKDKLPTFNAILSATDALEAGEYDQVTELLARVRESDPEMYLAPFLLGQSAARQEHWTDAAAEFKQCLKLNPNFEEAMTALAGALFRSGDAAGARGWLQKAIAANASNYRAWYELGGVESQRNAAAAEAAYRKTLAVQPNFAPAHRDLGMLYYGQKKWAEALTELEATIKQGSHEKELLNFAGVAASNSGRQAKAITFFKRALAQDGSYADAEVNMALALQRDGKAAEAKQAFQKACSLNTAYCQYLAK
jgi:arylsulfatase A-like enzyme/Tfp pilus assembly protein PilF